MQLILEIILEREVRLDGLPRRSRYYQSHIDVKLLEPGTVDFSLLGDVILILIAPFDLIGDGCYRYTFRMCCMENKERILEDGAVRIFLNTHGKNPKEISPELVQLLHFMDHTNEAPPADGECEKVQRLRKKIEAIKSNEEVGVRFMQEWEERELERIDARKEGEKIGEERGEQRGLKLGKQRGLMLGEQNKLRTLVQKKLAKKTVPGEDRRRSNGGSGDDPGHCEKSVRKMKSHNLTAGCCICGSLLFRLYG